MYEKSMISESGYKDNCHIITIPHNVVGNPCRKFLSLSVREESGCCLGGMLRDLSHAEFIFGVYLENLIGMDTRMKDSIDLDNIIMQLFRTLIS